jgi:hypothetical protein
MNTTETSREFREIFTSAPSDYDTGNTLRSKVVGYLIKNGEAVDPVYQVLVLIRDGMGTEDQLARYQSGLYYTARSVDALMKDEQLDLFYFSE